MKINIVSQDASKFRKAQRIRNINAIVTVGSVSLFALSVLMISGQFVYLGYRSRQLTSSMQTLGKLYDTRSKDQAEYVVVKRVMDMVDQIQTGRFKYKIFLNGIYGLLPSKAKLASVDFDKSGVVVVSVRLQTLTDYDVLLMNIDSGQTDKTFLFSAIAQPTLQMDKLGQYLVKLELKIK